MSAPVDTSPVGSCSLNGGRPNATNSNSTYFERFEMVLSTPAAEKKVRLQRIQHWVIMQVQTSLYEYEQVVSLN
jgi:hypothetical protein